MYLTIKQIEHEMNIPGCYFYEHALEKNVGLVVQADIKNYSSLAKEQSFFFLWPKKKYTKTKRRPKKNYGSVAM
jgi:hypothetical protein